MIREKLEDYVRTIPDFPEPGIMFRDITTILSDADGLKLAIDEMQKTLDGVDFDVIAGAESRGFIFGAAIAYNMHKYILSYVLHLTPSKQMQNLGFPSSRINKATQKIQLEI